MTEDKPQEEKQKVETGKGSIVLEILIIVAFFLMVASIYIPKNQWEIEETHLENCQKRLSNIEESMKFFYMANNFYTDTLSSLINFTKTTTNFRSEIDSALTLPPDSLFRCPQTSMEYTIKIEDKVHYEIACPNTDQKERYWLFFTKEIKNHGNIKDGVKSWE